MKIKLRDYQINAVANSVNFLRSNTKKNGIIVIPTGGGKSWIIAGIAQELSTNILVLCPNREIVLQNQEKMELVQKGVTSIYSASCGSKEISKITFGTIGSVMSKIEDFDHFKCIIIDECFTGETEILTEHGFIPFRDLPQGIKVAQFDKGRISFCNPLRYIQREHCGEMYHVKIKNGVIVPMTSGHNMVLWHKNKGFYKQQIQDIKFGNGKLIPVSGLSEEKSGELTNLERLYIAIQADGTIHHVTEKFVTVGFNLKKPEKIHRLINLCGLSNIEIRELKVAKNGARRFMCKMPCKTTKNIAEHITYPMSATKAQEVIEECILWDGCKPKGHDELYYFSSTDKTAVDFYNAVATIAGHSCYISKQEGKRKPNHRDVYRLFIRINQEFRDTQRISKSTCYYSGKVYCVEVPSGAIIVRHNGYTFASGNCHTVNAIAGQYKTFIERVPRRVLGLTATPYRLSASLQYLDKDGRPHFRPNDEAGSEEFDNKIFNGELTAENRCILKFLTRTRPRVFDEVVYQVDIGTLLQRGYLAKLRYFDLSPIDQSRLKRNSTGMDYDEKELKKDYKANGMIQHLVDIVQRLQHPKDGKPRKGILVFTRFIDESEALAKSVDGVAIITGSTKKKEREQILADFKSGKVKVVANVGVLTTGFDYPELDTIVMARPTMSLALWYQIVGRAIRPHPDKECAWIVDLGGNFKRFGRVEDLHLNAPGGLYQITGFADGVTKALTNVYF